MTQDVDVLVIGGGPAGLSAAVVFARNGLKVRVCEQKKFPVDKACGEGIMPNGVDHLKHLGVLHHLTPADYFAFSGIRYISRTGVTAEGLFPGTGGLGIRRTILSTALIQTAAQFGNLEVQTGIKAVPIKRHADSILVSVGGQNVRTRLLVGADGLRSGVRKWAGLDGPPAKFHRWGASQQYSISPWTSFVEIYWGAGIEAYVTPLRPDSIGVAFLWDRARYPRVEGGHRLIPALIDKFPLLKERLDNKFLEGEPRVTGQLQHTSRVPVENGVLLIGDAAGYLDAITGEGISLSTAQALAIEKTVVPALLRTNGNPTLIGREHLSGYKRAVKKIVRPYYQTTAMALWISRHPDWAERAIHVLAHHPALFQHLIAANMGYSSLYPGLRKTFNYLIAMPMITKKFSKRGG